jgi:pilus assembly protein CpaF
VRNALRLRPDRIIVGEVRGAEAFDMLQAINTGHTGSLTTCHANSATDALVRLETMALLAGVGVPIEAIRRQLVAAIGLVVFVAREPGGGRQIVELLDVQEGSR